MDDEQRQLLHLGQSLFLKGQYLEAERALARFGERYPNYADVQNMLGLIYHEQGQFLRAQRCFEAALKVNPRYTEAALNLAVIYNDQGRYEDAKNIHQAAQARVVESPDTLDPYLQGKIANLYADIGDVFAQTGHLRNAIAELRRALILGPKFADVRLRLAKVMRDAGDRQGALTELEALVHDTPAFVPARIALGVTYLTLGRKDDAELTFREALSRRPEDRLAQMYLRICAREESEQEGLQTKG
jgi:tetratricopeptide (TPR) repeat protein